MVIFINSSTIISFILASFSAVCITKDGSFFFPRLGTGAKYGLSVSINNLLSGIDLNVFEDQRNF